MLKLDNHNVDIRHFPDGTIHIVNLQLDCGKDEHNITWNYANNEEFLSLYYIVQKIRENSFSKPIFLDMPYIPNARMDRIQKSEDVFSLKYFCKLINLCKFDRVTVLDPHSYVSAALIDNVVCKTPECTVNNLIKNILKLGNVILFYPDEGACKKYTTIFNYPYTFGVKRRDWDTGKILSLDIIDGEAVENKTVLIVDDICSKGGTFYHSAKELKKYNPKNIYLYVSHCENTILNGDMINSGLIDHIYTTDSIFTKEHELITKIPIL